MFQILERHITLDHNMKGSDHIASLDPRELKQLVTEVRRIESAMGSYNKFVQDGEQACYEKVCILKLKFLTINFYPF